MAEQQGSKEGSSGLPLHKLIDCKPLLDQLARCLDREQNFANNWSHLCYALVIEPNTLEKFNLYRKQSPTISLFKYLSTTQPDLSIGQLKVALSEIGRNDICQFIYELTDVNCSVSEKVTFSSSDVLDKIAQKLDIAEKPLGNWEDLAQKRDVPRKIYQKFDMFNSYNPTVLLLRHIYITYKEAVTVEQVMDALKVMDRKDVLRLLRKQNFQGDQIFKEVVKLESDVCNDMADYLNCEIPVAEGWKTFGHLLGVKAEILNDLEPPKEKAFHSPTKKMLTWLASERPEMTVEELMVSLESIKRRDAVEIIINSLYNTDPANSCPTGESTSAIFGIPATNSDPVLTQIAFRNHGFGMPQRPTMELIGRDKELAILQRYFSSTQLIQDRVLLLHSPPGFGKTMLVLHALYRAIDSNDGIFVIYVNSRNVYSIDDLAVKILEAYGNYDVPNPVRQVRRLLELSARDNVIVIENFDHMFYAKSIELPPKRKNSSASSQIEKEAFCTFVLDIAEVCSRVRLLVSSWERLELLQCPVEHLCLEPLKDKEAEKLLMQRSETPLDPDQVKRMVTCCGGVPLLLRASVVTVMRRLSSDKVEKMSPELLQLLSPDTLLLEERMEHCMGVFFDRMDPSLQYQLLAISLFPDSFAKRMLEIALGDAGVSETKLEECLFTLENKYGFIRLDNMSRTYTCHSFVRSFCILKASNDETEDKPGPYKLFYEGARRRMIFYYLDKLCEVDAQFFSKHSQTAVDRYRKHRDMFKQIFDWCIKDETLPTAVRDQVCANAFVEAAVFLGEVMTDSKFNELFEKLSKDCDSDDKKGVYRACLGMKMAQSCQCNTDAVCEHLEKALAYLVDAPAHAALMNQQMNEPTNDEPTRDVTGPLTLSKYGRCLVQKGETSVGFTHISTALVLGARLKESNRKKNRVIYASLVNDLAAAERYAGRPLDEMDLLLNHVLPVYKRELESHPWIADTCSRVAMNYAHRGYHMKAMDWHEKAYRQRQELLGSHHSTAQSLYNLGSVFFTRAQSELGTKRQWLLERAIDYLKPALDMQEKVLCPLEQVAQTRQQMAVVLKALGRDVEAEQQTELIAQLQRLDLCQEDASPIMSPAVDLRGHASREDNSAEA